MKVLVSLILAFAQLLAFGFAAPLAAPNVAVAQSLGEIERPLSLRTGTAQLSPEEAPRAPEFFSFGESTVAPVGTAASATGMAATGGTMRVQIDMFSGRPNPSWEISAQEADQVRAMFRQLPERGAAARSERLGYRGLIVQGDGVRELGLTRILIGSGVVIAEGFHGVRYLSDADRGLERQIFQTGRTRLDPTDYAAFKSIAFP